MIKRILLLGTVGLTLVGCGMTNEATANGDVAEVRQASTEEVEVHKSPGYFVDQIETTVIFKTTQLPDITEEELELADEIMSHLNEASTPKPGGDHVTRTDRGYIETFADKFPEYTVDELVEVHNKAGEYRMNKDFGEEYIGSNDFLKGLENNLEVNLRYDLDFRTWNINSGSTDFNEDQSVVTYKAEYLRNNGDIVPVEMSVEFEDDDYTTGKLIRLTVDGEDAFE